MCQSDVVVVVVVVAYQLKSANDGVFVYRP
jgi:hypothetical protein